MKQIIAFLALTMSIIASAQVSIGMRDNRFAYGAFTYKEHYALALEQSIFSEKPGYQYLRGYVGYIGAYKDLEYSAMGYFGSTYNRSYWSSGVAAHAKYLLKNVVIIEGKLNPHYDSGDGYATCWYAGAGARITRHIDVLAGYGNIPEYRLPEHRFKVGFKFSVGDLSVSPRVSMKMCSGHGERSIRTLLDFNYKF